MVHVYGSFFHSTSQKKKNNNKPEMVFMYIVKRKRLEFFFSCLRNGPLAILWLSHELSQSVPRVQTHLLGQASGLSKYHSSVNKACGCANEETMVSTLGLCRSNCSLNVVLFMSLVSVGGVISVSWQKVYFVQLNLYIPIFSCTTASSYRHEVYPHSNLVYHEKAPAVNHALTCLWWERIFRGRWRKRSQSAHKLPQSAQRMMAGVTLSSWLSQVGCKHNEEKINWIKHTAKSSAVVSIHFNIYFLYQHPPSYFNFFFTVGESLLKDKLVVYT